MSGIGVPLSVNVCEKLRANALRCRRTTTDCSEHRRRALRSRAVRHLATTGRRIFTDALCRAILDRAIGSSILFFEIPTELNTQSWMPRFAELEPSAKIVHLANCPSDKRLELAKIFLLSTLNRAGQRLAHTVFNAEFLSCLIPSAIKFSAATFTSNQPASSTPTRSSRVITS